MSCMCSITAGLFFICVVIFSLYISQKWLNIQVMKAAMGYSTVLWVRQWSGTALTAVFVCELKQRAAIVLTLIHSFSNWRALHFTLFKEHNRTPYTFIFFLDKFRKRGRNHSFCWSRTASLGSSISAEEGQYAPTWLWPFSGWLGAGGGHGFILTICASRRGIYEGSSHPQD